MQGEGASPRQLNLFQRPSVGGAGGSVARSQLLLHRLAAAIEQGGLHAGGRHGDAAAAVDVDVIDGDGAAEAAAPVGADGGAGGVGADRDATAAHRCTGERRGQVLVPAARIGGRVGIAVDGADRLQRALRCAVAWVQLALIVRGADPEGVVDAVEGQS